MTRTRKHEATVEAPARLTGHDADAVLSTQPEEATMACCAQSNTDGLAAFTIGNPNGAEPINARMIHDTRSAEGVLLAAGSVFPVTGDWVDPWLEASPPLLVRENV